MPAHEVNEPIISSPYEEPSRHWKIHEHEPPELINSRREPTYMYLPTGKVADDDEEQDVGYEIKLEQVALIRQRLADWRPHALQGEGGVSRTTMDLLKYWRREGREQPLFFAQLEAAEAIIFLTEARLDFQQGINIPLEEMGEKKQRDGFKAFKRYCCQMATGTGKTTVMAMLTAWSILNKVANKGDTRFSDAILVVCPNVTIRDRLAELNPQRGDASIYQTRDLVPPAMMADLTKGKFFTTNWHIFEPRSTQGGSKVVKAGQRVLVKETVFIGDKAMTARGKRYMTEDHLRQQQALNLLRVRNEHRDSSGSLKKVEVESEKYMETDAALVRRVLEKELGSKKNILVLNDEAHHAYRLQSSGEGNGIIDEEDEAAEYYYREATTWVDGLDKINNLRGINFCVDFSATPYFLGQAGANTNRIFPWTASSFGLQDAIESGLVKIPQLAARDSSGATVPGYFNIWKWILPKLTATERGGKKAGAKPEATLKYAHTPIAMMGGMWQDLHQELGQLEDSYQPVLIVICKTKKLANIVYDWIAEDQPPTPTIPRAGLPELKNALNQENTICVYSDMQVEIESGVARTDETRWMRHTLDTIGRGNWPRDRQGREQYPEGFVELADKLGREKYPPGRDVRCIVSVGMLTEGWDCNTVTHIIGLRPFMSQLLCEQVIGRGLRRTSYEIGKNGHLPEEIATVLGVPLSAFTVKVKKGGDSPKKVARHHIHALPDRQDLAISFPRVEGYYQSIRIGLSCDMKKIPPVCINAEKIPPEVQMKAGLPSNSGIPSISGPGELRGVDLKSFRQTRLQQRAYELTGTLAKFYAEEASCQLPPNILFQQLFPIVCAYIERKVTASHPSDKKDVFLAPYYGWIVETLCQYIKPDASAGDIPELPRCERQREMGSTGDVDFYSKREPYPVLKSHINAVVPDSGLERKAAYCLDNHPKVLAFAKNEGMGFGIPYFHNGEMHDYIPDFLVRLKCTDAELILILETKLFYDDLKEIKRAAAERWVGAVNADDRHGRWCYRMVEEVSEINDSIEVLAQANMRAAI
ncbi:MAG: DEAD/DEAH box helicase family protein [Gammaproteobacteria bacterium]|nr:DEAD/DEAH box helicase family protein [Gammaproteobacteria bacterium]